ncbi:MAG TPA: hypothetical protein VEG34_14070 [Thermoanaerobaculia bacterium]|nr:hypothetical protein [Thermoanaerobaculia bacterium]
MEGRGHGGRAALVIAHPGHELRVHGWLEQARPLVCILTDGSGGAGSSRLDSTRRVLAAAGAVPGPVFGRFTDRELYADLLAGEAGRFVALAAEVAAALEQAGVDLVAGDAAEGFNTGHDLCRLVINAAALRLAGSGRPLANLELLLDDHPDLCPDELRGEALRLDLDDEALARKLAVARGYPEIASEVESALARFGEAPFRTEILRPVRYGLDLAPLFADPPFYETYGEQQVAAGRYSHVIRLRQHVAPIAAALAAWAAAPVAPVVPVAPRTVAPAAAALAPGLPVAAPAGEPGSPG